MRYAHEFCSCERSPNLGACIRCGVEFYDMQGDGAGLFIDGDLPAIIPRGKGNAIGAGDIAGRSVACARPLLSIWTVPTRAPLALSKISNVAPVN